MLQPIIVPSAEQEYNLFREESNNILDIVDLFEFYV